jgi:hypothetical protein
MSLIYSPLRNEIRYQALLSGKFHNPIKWRPVQGRELPGRISYKTLSYEWGPPEPEHSITVNGVSTQIRESFRNALRRPQRRAASVGCDLCLSGSIPNETPQLSEGFCLRFRDR